MSSVALDPAQRAVAGATGLDSFFQGPGRRLSYSISKKQADEALERILATTTESDIIDVTDGKAFDWRRFLCSHSVLSPLMETTTIVRAAVFRGRVCKELISRKAALGLLGVDDITYVVSPTNISQSRPLCKLQLATTRSVWNPSKISKGPNTSWLSLQT